MRWEGVRYNRLHSGFPLIKPCVCFLEGRNSFPQVFFWSNTWISQEKNERLAQLWMRKARELVLVWPLFISCVAYFMYIIQHSSAESSSSSSSSSPVVVSDVQQTWLIWTRAVSFVFSLARLPRPGRLLHALLFWFPSIEPGWMCPLRTGSSSAKWTMYQCLIVLLRLME